MGEVAVTRRVFLFTDLVDSTPLLERIGSDQNRVLDLHDRLITEACIRHGGSVVKSTGDGFLVVFDDATRAVRAALDARDAVDADPALSAAGVCVRVGVHAGTAIAHNGDYRGLDVNIAARVEAAANPSQVLATDAVVGDLDAPDLSTVDCGLYVLKGVTAPARLHHVARARSSEPVPRPRAAAVRRTNLEELYLAPFVGRSPEVKEVAALARRERILCVIGMGGMGKTRIAIEAASALLDDFEDGVWFVDLVAQAPVLALASAMGISPSGETSTVVEHLRGKRALVVLDNAEHVLDATRDLTRRLLRTCREVHVVATSREPLRLAGEVLWQTPPMSRDDGVALFRERIGRGQAFLTLTPADLDAIPVLVSRLERVPLAVELAAARARVLHPTVLVDELRSALSLRGGDPSTPRHSTMEAALEWSWQLLDTELRAALMALGATRASVTLDVAAQLCHARREDGLEAVTALAERSLVAVEPASHARVSMLEPVREFARRELEKSGRVDVVRRRHLLVMASIATEAADRHRRGDQDAWNDVAHHAAEVDDALVYAFDGDVALGAELVVLLVPFWMARGDTAAAADVASTFATSPELDGATRSLLHLAAATLSWNASQYDAARRCLGRVDRATSGLINAEAASADAALALGAGDLYAAEALLLEAQVAWDDAGATHGPFGSVLVVMHNRAVVARERGDFDCAATLLDECIARARASGDPFMEANHLMALGKVHQARGEFTAAEAVFGATIRLCRRVRYVTRGLFATQGLAECARLRGEVEGVAHRYLVALGGLLECSDVPAIAACLAGLGKVVADDEPDVAARLFGAVDRLCEDVGSPLLATWEGSDFELHRERLRRALGQEVFGAMEAEGWAAGLDGALADIETAWPLPAADEWTRLM